MTTVRGRLSEPHTHTNNLRPLRPLQTLMRFIGSKTFFYNVKKTPYMLLFEVLNKIVHLFFKFLFHIIRQPFGYLLHFFQETK